MLAVWIDRENFEYDINALVKAFYPEETVCVLTPGTGENKKARAQEYIRFQIFFSEEGALLLDAEKGDAAGEEEGRGRTLWHWDASGGEPYKDCFKRFFYEYLRRITGRELPWGNLIGIRPTKIAYGMLEEGKTEDEILEYLEKQHYVSEKKGRLSIDIARREREILSSVRCEDGYSLYIGIPFCPTTCMYCSFTSYPIAAYRKQVSAYIDCLIREMDFVAGQCADRFLETVYIGGGTPTTLEADELDRLLGALGERFDLGSVREFTVEAGRADSITEDRLKVLRRCGVSRISVNPQTMKQETLDIIGRRHTVEQVVEAFHLARKAGFDNINMDLILGLPGEDAQDVRNTIERIKELSPDSLTVHSLAVKRASRLGGWIREHGSFDTRNTDETMEIASEGAAALGMEPYYLYRQKNMSGNFENVGYARPGKFGLYNVLIMEEVQTILALGAGSISKRVTRRTAADGSAEMLIGRCENVKEVLQYIHRIDEMIERKKYLMIEERENAT